MRNINTLRSGCSTLLYVFKYTYFHYVWLSDVISSMHCLLWNNWDIFVIQKPFIYHDKLTKTYILMLSKHILTDLKANSFFLRMGFSWIRAFTAFIAAGCKDSSEWDLCCFWLYAWILIISYDGASNECFCYIFFFLAVTVPMQRNNCKSVFLKRLLRILK